VQRELRAVPAAPAAALGALRPVVVEARAAFGCSLVSLSPLLVGHVGALRETQVRARRAARVRSLAARLPALAGRTRQPLRSAVDAATFDEEELLAALPHADARSKVISGSPLGNWWVPDFWPASVGPRRKLGYGGSR